MSYNKHDDNYIENVDKELKMLQQVQFEILNWVVDICEKNKLNYFLAGGTLIGAVRHQGFIPWDDDIDISMPRKDYEKFLKITSSNKDKNYFVQHHITEKKYWCSFAKVRKRNTYFGEIGIDNYYGEKGIFLDIFPLDYVPKKDCKVQLIQAAIVNSIKPILRWRAKSTGNIFKIILIGGIFNLFSTNKLIEIREKVMTFYNNVERDYFVNLGSAYGYKKQTIPINKFFPYRRLSFNGKLFRVPNDYDYILTNIYGDYMKLPPIEKRKKHLDNKVIFNTLKHKEFDK